MEEDIVFYIGIFGVFLIGVNVGMTTTDIRSSDIFDNLKLEHIEESENMYYTGLVRGCDIGCIDYDLRINNISWDDEKYNIFKSDNYKECSKYCVRNMGAGRN